MPKSTLPPIETTATETHTLSLQADGQSPNIPEVVESSTIDGEKVLLQMQELHESIARGDLHDPYTQTFDNEAIRVYIETIAPEIGKMAGTPGSAVGETIANPEQLGNMIKLIAESEVIRHKGAGDSARLKVELQNEAIKLQKTIELAIEAENAKSKLAVVQAETAVLENGLVQKQLDSDLAMHEAKVEVEKLKLGLEQIDARLELEKGQLTQAQEKALHTRRLLFIDLKATAQGVIEQNTFEIARDRSMLERAQHEISMARSRMTGAIEHLRIDLEAVCALADTRRRYANERVKIEGQFAIDEIQVAAQVEIEKSQANERVEREKFQSKARIEAEKINAETKVLDAQTAAHSAWKGAKRKAKVTVGNDAIADIEAVRNLEKIRIRNWKKHNGRRVFLGLAAAVTAITFSNFVDDNPKFEGSVPLTGLINGAWDRVAQPTIDGMADVLCELPGHVLDCR